MGAVDIQTFKDFIYKDASNAVPLAYQDLMKTFDSDYQLYQDSEIEKLQWIESTLREMRENLVESPFKASFALNVIKDNLFTALKDFCNSWPISFTEDHEYLACSCYDDNLFDSIYVEKYNYKDLFSYVIIEFVKPLVLHIALYQIYIELKRRKAEILEKSILLPEKELPATPSIETPGAKEDPQYALDCQLIFKDLEARMLFEYLQSNLVREKTPLADYIFIFRRMQKDGYILEGIKEKTFREFLTHHFQIHFNSKLKPMGYCTTDWKEKMYTNAITSIQTR